MTFFDCHCHTERSACAEDVSLEMYRALAAASCGPFAITDHSAHLYYPPENRWGFWTDEAEAIFEQCRDEGLARCADYVRWVREAQCGKMLLGVELDVLPDGRVVFDQALLSELDIILGAVHNLRGLAADRPLPEVIGEYKSRTLRLCELGVHVIVHPFREWRSRGRQVPSSLLHWTVETARQAGAALELNCHYPVPECDVPMVKMCAQMGVKVAIGTDTHRRHEFGDFTYHEQVLRQAGVPKEKWGELLMAPPRAAASLTPKSQLACETFRVGGCLRK